MHIADAQSLKDKRQVLRSLKTKLRFKFNVAVAELDHQDVWQRSVSASSPSLPKRSMYARSCRRPWTKPMKFWLHADQPGHEIV